MRINNRIILLFVLPTLAPLILPPDILLTSILTVLVAAAAFLATGYLVYRGMPRALTLLIFMLGVNFITRLMMFFSTAVSAQGVINWPFTITSLLSLCISFYLVFRLDQVDIRAQLRS
jgi:hypothetical protein